MELFPNLLDLFHVFIWGNANGNHLERGGPFIKLIGKSKLSHSVPVEPGRNSSGLPIGVSCDIIHPSWSRGELRQGSTKLLPSKANHLFL